MRSPDDMRKEALVEETHENAHGPELQITSTVAKVFGKIIDYFHRAFDINLK